MIANAIIAAFKVCGWSLAESATDLGHMAEADKWDHQISVAAPSSVMAWQILWTLITSGRAFEGRV